MGEVVRVDQWEDGQEYDDAVVQGRRIRKQSSPEERLSWLEQEVVRLLFRHPIGFYLASLAAAAAVVAVLWPQVRSPFAATWIGLATALAVAQISLVGWYRRQDKIADETVWGKRYVAGSTLCGALWGLSSALLFPAQSLPHQSFLIAIMGGVTAMALAVLVPSRWGFVLFAVPALVPLATRLALVGGTLHVTMAALTATFLVALLGASRQLRKSLVDGLTSRYENEELISELSHVNERLISQIEARQAIDRELEKRDQILEAVSFAGERLLHSKTTIDDPRPILARLGEASGARRLSLITVRYDDNEDVPEFDQHHEWRIDDPDVLARQPPFFPAANPRWTERLRRGRVISGAVTEFPAADRTWLHRFSVESLAVLPIFSESEWWGLLALEDRAERTWSKSELEALTTAADIFGAAAHRIAAEQALARSDSRYQMLAENTNDLVGLHDLSGRYLYVSPSCTELLGYRPEELLGKDLGLLCSEEQLKRLQTECLGPAQEGEISTIRWQVRHQGGELRWFETTAQAVEDSSGEVSMLVSSSRDVTGHKETEDQLFREKELAQVTLQSIGDGVITTSAAGRVRYVNPVAAQLTGWTNAAARGKAIERILSSARTEDQARVVQLLERSRNADQQVQSDKAIRLLDRDAEELAVEVSCSPIHDQTGQTLGTVIVLRDVTRTHKLAAQLTYQATHDSLTGMLNRHEFESRLGALVRDIKTRDATGKSAGLHALCYLDLDQFKVVNDTCGHIAGDELLRQISKSIRSQLRHSDTVARLGGDEFGILLRDCPIEKAEQMAENLCTTLRDHRFTWQEQVFRIGASIGVVEIDSKTQSDAQVLSAADAACYVAKDKGRGRVHRFKPDDRHLAIQTGEMQWVSAIHAALESDRFMLRYQPIVPPGMPKDDPKRIEILLSMIGNNGEEISPGSFIPAAERFNAMSRLDRWVVHNTFKKLAPHWIGGSPHIRETFINLSGTSIADESFLSFLKGKLREFEVPEGIVCFEITETAAIANLSSAATFMQELRELGCSFALDDFGSGLSSFGYLRSLPVDFIKIDGTFVREIAYDMVDYAIVESIQNVGRQLGIKTIAEFVETEDALAKLILLGVDLVQGFAIAPPAPLDPLLEQLGSPSARPQPVS